MVQYLRRLYLTALSVPHWSPSPPPQCHPTLPLWAISHLWEDGYFVCLFSEFSHNFIQQYQLIGCLDQCSTLLDTVWQPRPTLPRLSHTAAIPPHPHPYTAKPSPPNNISPVIRWVLCTPVFWVLSTVYPVISVYRLPWSMQYLLKNCLATLALTPTQKPKLPCEHYLTCEKMSTLCPCFLSSFNILSSNISLPAAFVKAVPS